MTDPFVPRAAAKAAFDRCSVRPTSSVGYVSHGRLLVLGSSAQVAAVVERLPENLTPFLLLSDAAAPQPAVRHLPYRHMAGAVTAQGWLGAFQVDGEAFDLLLDLSSRPLIGLPVPPPGYFAPQNDPQRLDAALQQLADLLGEFDKPKYFSYRPEICAHHTAAVHGCQACLDVCGAAAIRPGDARVEVEPHLCQGCGDCASACPSGAMGYAYPPLGDTLNRLRLMLEAWRKAGGSAPVLLLHGGDSGMDEAALPEWLLPYRLEALGAAGMDAWLSALAYGAAAVWLLDNCGLSRLAGENLERQLGYANSLLQAMGYGEECLRILLHLEKGGRGDLSASDGGTNAGIPPWSPFFRGGDGDGGEGGAIRVAAAHAGQDDKRTALRLALEHLHRHAPRQPETVALAEGAPYGQIAVDGGRCTLCMACVSACPAGALQDGGDQPQLRFIEANCVQCGRCADACPEDAIALQPRYLFDMQQARQPRLLHQADVFRCVECGKPFASVAMIQTITDKLKDHPMFQGDAARRLRLCEDCRVNAHFRSL